MLGVMASNLRSTSSTRRALSAVLSAVLSAGILFGTAAAPLDAQAAVDPNVAPRAAQLERQGERQIATDLLGRYLAVAPDDGKAWFQLGRFYRLDARDWHQEGHAGDPDGQLYLDLAGVAVDQAMRLAVDSAVLLRSMIDMDRALLFIEDSGWAAARDRGPRSSVELPRVVIELGYNLLGSCPVNGVLVTGSELENVAVWHGLLESGFRTDIILLRTDLYATDSLYRERMAAAMDVAPVLPVRGALTAVVVKRPLCLTPGADTAAAEAATAVPMQLVRVLGANAGPTENNLSLTELLLETRQGGSVWTREVLAVYGAAASHNAVLCASLAVMAGELPLETCRR